VADNTTLNPGVAGDVMRTVDNAGVKTPVSQIQIGGGTTIVDSAHGLPVAITDNTNTLGTTAHPVQTRPSADGTNPVDATHPLHVRPSADGTNPVDVTHGLPVNIGTMKVAKGATLPTVGVVIKASPGSAWFIELANTTGGTVFMQIHDLAATTLSGGEQPNYFPPTGVSTSTTTTINLGHQFTGAPCPSTGVLLVASSTNTTYTAIASTAILYILYYI
jgi:hypothetical protein